MKIHVVVTIDGKFALKFPVINSIYNVFYIIGLMPRSFRTVFSDVLVGRQCLS